MSDFVPVGFFDDQVVELQFPPYSQETEAAWAAFQALTVEDRQHVSRHVYAYYLDTHDSTEEAEGTELLDDKIGFPKRAEAIWSHVQPRSILVQDGDDETPGSAYVVVEADCDWDDDLGLMLVWQDGKWLNRVGPYDGHLTNVVAFANPELERVVYKAGSNDFITYRDDIAAE